MKNSVKLTIDGREVTVSEGTTLLDAATQLGIQIPAICYHPHLTANGLCRVCSVDAGGRVQAAACVTQCQDGMEVRTGSPAVMRARRTILELLASTVDLSEAPEILDLIEEYEAESDRFLAATGDQPLFTMTIPSICETTISVSIAGVVYRCVPTMLNMHSRCPSTPADFILTSARLWVTG